MYQNIRVRVRVRALTNFVLELSELVVLSRTNHTRIAENKKEGEVESIIFLVHITPILHIIFLAPTGAQEVGLSVRLSVCPSVCLSVCPSVPFSNSSLNPHASGALGADGICRLSV